MILVPGRLTDLASATGRALVRHFDPVPRPWLRSTEDPDDCRWRAVVERDARVDGAFVYAVSTTGVFCRPSCGARTPLRKNVSFYRAPPEARLAGFRACKRCTPESAGVSSTAQPASAASASPCPSSSRRLPSRALFLLRRPRSAFLPHRCSPPSGGPSSCRVPHVGRR
jgi:hypothetical protein